MGKFPEPRARFYSAEITLALEHIHKLDIVYRCDHLMFAPLAVLESMSVVSVCLYGPSV